MTSPPADSQPHREPQGALEAENAELRATVSSQAKRIADQAKRIADQAKRIADQEKRIADQAKRIAALESELADLLGRLGQDSKNSSAPPSRDNASRRERRAAERAERKAALAKKNGGEQRKPGKQPGTPGTTLMRRSPDRTITHVPLSCRCCGDGLEAAPVVGRATRQVLEVPEPRLEVIDHVAERRRCRCGVDTTAVFPSEAIGPVCWGPGARARAAYLMGRQHLPLERTAEAMDVLFAAPMGEGILAGLMPEASQRLTDFVGAIRSLLMGCPVTYADETSIRVGTRPGWVHTVSSPGLTMLSYHHKRGIDAICEIGVLNGYRGVIVHDGLAAYDRPELSKASHAQCGAHLLRHLDKVGTVWSQRDWTRAMRACLLDAKAASEDAADVGLACVAKSVSDPIVARYTQILDQAVAALPPGP
ncbi:MAG: IS66 family transposase, partial [Candidatus Dormibacteria bacterium]